MCRPVRGTPTAQGCTIRSSLQPNGEARTFIARLLAGSFAERCSLLFEGDEIVAVNDTPVRGMATDGVLELMGQDRVNLVLGILPKVSHASAATCCPADQLQTHTRVAQVREVLPKKSAGSSTTYVRALYSYDPLQDDWAPCPEGGLPFKRGDVLQVRWHVL
jgi:hypothetical protein